MITMPANSDEALTAAIGLLPQRPNAIIGSGERRSCQTKVATAMTATAASSADSLRLAVENAVMVAITAAMARTKTPALTWSIRPRAAETRSCRQNQKPAAATRPTGRFIQKIQDHDHRAMMIEPTSGPSTAEVAQTLASHPWILPRSWTE